jgi:large subunit ribosomal protein L9
MKLILIKRVPKLGNEWDVVTVKDGYARNYLLPKRLADPASPALIKKAEKIQAERVKKLEEIIKNAKELAEKLKGAEISFSKKSRGEKLYGSIGDKDIIEAMKEEHKIEISKDMLKLKEPIKTLGDHKITLVLAEGVEVGIKVIVKEEK